MNQQNYERFILFELHISIFLFILLSICLQIFISIHQFIDLPLNSLSISPSLVHNARGFQALHGRNYNVVQPPPLIHEKQAEDISLVTKWLKGGNNY